MGQTNTERVSHDVDKSPNTFRDDQMNQIIDDIGEELTGKGFIEAIYLDPPDQNFIDQIIVWDAPAKNKKRSETTFSRSGPVAFITSIVTDTFNEDGTAVIATTTTTITLSGSKQFLSSNTVTVRP